MIYKGFDYLPPLSKIGNDIFIIENTSNDYIVYAPLRQIILKANGNAVNILYDYLHGDNTLSNSEIIINAERIGLFAPLDYNKLSLLFHQQWQPLTSITISLTYSCNLNCIYCYANGGDYHGTVDNELIKDSIEFVAQNSKEAGYDFLRLGFHGTGEATLAWDKLEYAVKFAEETAAKKGLKPYISLTTNGTLITKKRADFIEEHQIHISISLDGYDEIQNKQRPLKNKKDSIESITRSIKYLQELNIYFSLRATVLPEATDKLCKIVNFVYNNIFLHKHGKIIFEPVEIVGRANKNDLMELNPDLFIQNYKEAVLLGNRLGMNITCSADLRLGYRQSFCDANGRIFLLLPTGEISSCTRITMINDKLAPIFIYGYYDKKTKKINIDKEKLNILLGLDLFRNEQCKNCFCKWHCAGQCIAASYSTDGHWEKMCYITRELAKWRLNNLLNAV